MTYSDKLKDPRWQKKRLEVMQAADFKCEICESKENSLHVHHINYKKGAKPWDYDLNELKCICETCHEKVETAIREARAACVEMDPHDFSRCVHYVKEAHNQLLSENQLSWTLSVLNRASVNATATAMVYAFKDGDKLDQEEAKDLKEMALTVLNTR